MAKMARDSKIAIGWQLHTRFGRPQIGNALGGSKMVRTTMAKKVQSGQECLQNGPKWAGRPGADLEDSNMAVSTEP